MADSPAPVVAAFDLDGTLTEGGSVFLWLRRLAGTFTTYRVALRLLVPLTVGAIRSNRWADSAKERLFHSLLAGRDVEQLAKVSREFALEHLEHEGRSALIERLDWHRTQGHDVVIVSASPQIYVDVIAEALRADGALGTRLAVDPRGRLTGSYLGKNCRGSEKMRRLSEWIESRHYPAEPVIYAYGNSRGDRRLLAGATYPFNAGKLGRLGALRKFPRMRSATEA
jgi:phosphatidylglycerophosphatase C